jgi:hypothetical protein
MYSDVMLACQRLELRLRGSNAWKKGNSVRDEWVNDEFQLSWSRPLFYFRVNAGASSKRGIREQGRLVQGVSFVKIGL